MIRAGRAAAALLLCSLAVGCSGERGNGGPIGEPLEVPEDAPDAEADELRAQTNQRPVLLFFPSQDGELLVPEERIIFKTNTLTSQLKQAVSEVLLGPANEEADAAPAFPARTRLLAIFLLPDGTVVIDLGSEAGAIPHGSSAELAAVYAIVNTVVFNFPGVVRVRFLVEGQEVPTLAGHVDLSRPLLADLTRIDWGGLGPPADPAGAAAPWDRWILQEPPGPEPELERVFGPI